jgi:hypothetical protein
MNMLSKQDWTVQHWIEQFVSIRQAVFVELNLSAADESALRSIAADFNKRHDQLMLNDAKLDSPNGSPNHTPSSSRSW